MPLLGGKRQSGKWQAKNHCDPPLEFRSARVQLLGDPTDQPIQYPSRFLPFSF